MKFYRTKIIAGLVLLLAVVSAVNGQDLDYGAVPALTKPQGDQTAANQKLDFHADLFTGRFTDRVPIEVPPARNGAEPAIALQYNSSGGNGWCGVGWDLDMGYIQRETRHGVPLNFNSYDDSFGFIYSFAGQSGRLVLASDGSYRPEINTSFLKFVRTNGWWLVTDKSGKKYTFGDRPFTTVSPFGATASGTFKWMLSTIQDADSNQTLFGYTNLGNSEVHLAWISYNANANNATPTNNCSVFFQTVSRSDIPNSCLSGQPISTSQLLKYIYVNYNGKQVRQYVLAYTTSASTGRSLLQGVYEYGSDNATAWPAITFNYSVSANSFQPVQRWPITSQAPGSGSATYTSPSTPNTTLMDMNGDGLPDWVSSQYNQPMGYLAVQTNSGSGFGPVQYWPIDNETHQTIPLWNSVANFYVPFLGGKATSCKLVDINGDNLPDRVLTPANSGNYFQVQTNTGKGFGPVEHWNNVSANDGNVAPEWSGPGSSFDPGNYTAALLVDMTGDGLADLLTLGSSTTKFYVGVNQWLSSKNFSTDVAWGGMAGTADIRSEYNIEGTLSDLLDMNGDGLPDRIIKGGVQLNLGLAGLLSGFDSLRSWGMTNNEPISLQDWNTGNFYRQIMDINGDGLPDLVTATNSGGNISNGSYQVRLNTGSGFASTWTTWTGVDQTAGPAYGMQSWDSFSTRVIFVDMDGDGLPDRVVRNNQGGSDCLLVQLNSGPYPDLLTTVNNGIGGVVAVTYDSSTSFNNSDGTRPRLPFPVHVVTSVHTDGYMGSGTTTTYNYQYGLYDTAWREFRGFGIVDATDYFGTRTRTYFHQGGGANLSAHGEYQDARFKAGMPYDIITYGSDGFQYRETLNQITQVQVDANGVYFPFVTNVFELSSEPTTGYRATLKQFSYAVTPNNLAASTGNLLREANFGEVTNVLYNFSFSDVADAPVFSTFTYTNLSNPDIKDKPASITVSSDPAGNNILRQTQYQYFGATGNLQEKSELVCPNTFANTFYTYDSYGNPQNVTDPMGIVTTISYDPATATFPLRKVTGNLTNLMLYDPRCGNVLAATNEQGLVTANLYDVLLRLTNSAVSTTANGAATLTRSSYLHALGGVSAYLSQNYVRTRVNDPASSTGWHDTYTYFDGLGRPVQRREQTETNNTYRVTAMFYDARGSVLGETYPVFSTGTAYTFLTGTRTNTYTKFDALGRAQAFYPLASTPFNSSGAWTAYPTPLTGDGSSPVGPVSVDYNDGSNPWALVVTNALGKIHKYLLDAYGRTNQIVEVTSSGNYTTKLAYNPVGDLTNINDNASNALGMFYDLRGQRVALADPDMGLWQYNFDLDGRLKTQTDAKGQQMRFFYNDAAGRLTRREGWSVANQCVSTNTWAYDSNGGDAAYTVFSGQTFAVTDDEGWQKNSYDVRGRTLKTVRYLAKNGTAYTNQFAFDDADRLTANVYPNGGPTITNLFDTGGHLKSVKRVDSGGTNVTFYAAQGFNELQQLNGIAFGNGAATVFGYYKVSKRLNSIATTLTGGAAVQNFTNRYDAVGNIVGLQDLVSSHTNAASATISSASYDDLNRLATATWSGYGTKNYGYNSVGNVLTNGESGTTNYVYGSIRPHAVRSANGTWFTYDQNGNVVFRGRQRLDYDVNNHLYRVINTNGTVTTFGYAGSGERLWEQSGTNALQVWIGDNYEEKQGKVLFHIGAGGKRVCTFEPAAGGVTGYNATNQEFYYYHPDYLGSSSVMTDRTGTNAVQYYEYSAFGQTRYTGNTNAFKVSKRFTGQILDEDTGLYYYNARFYDPILGRFIQPDDIIPDIFDPQSYNRYSYVLNNPLRFTDPSGHSLEDYVLGMTGLAGFVANTRADEWATHIANKAGNMGFKSVSDVEVKLAEQKDPMGLNADVRLAKDRANAVSVTAQAAVGMAKVELSVESAIVAPGASALEGTGAATTAKTIANEAKVVRGGGNLPKDIARGTGTHPSGVTGVSVESAEGKSIEELSANIPHGQVGVTTVGEVRAAGGDVVRTSGRSPNHATLTGLPPEKTSSLLTPTVPNPAK